jgi:hypothetical protein
MQNDLVFKLNWFEFCLPEDLILDNWVKDNRFPNNILVLRDMAR